MKRYKNLSGSSGVVAYEATPGCMRVKFRNGDTYLYTAESAGADQLAAMHSLAAAGRGLSTFISTVVKDGFASRNDE